MVIPGRFPTLDEVEEALVMEALKRAKGNQGVAATLLGLSRRHSTGAWRGEAVAAGYGRLAKEPQAGRADAEKADQAVKSLTRTVRRALAELFQDNDFQNIFRRKEIYTQLSRAGDRLNICNSTLLDIVVKLC
jgi:hypothetical protein